MARYRNRTDAELMGSAVYPLTPDQVLPPPVTAASPEQRLIYEVLADALALIYVYHESLPPRHLSSYEEAVVWLWREWEVDRKWPTSALNVCRVMGIELEQVRVEVGMVLLGWRDAPSSLKLRYVAECKAEKIR